MSGVLTTEDLFLAGAGFDIAGAVLLGRGLIVSPIEARRRSASFLGYSPPVLARAASERVDGVVGLAALIAGFALQGTAYLVTIAGARVTEGGWLRAVVAGALALAGGLAVWLCRRAVAWPIMRPFIVDMAYIREDLQAARDQADARLLRNVGVLCGRAALHEEGMDGEGPFLYAARVYGLERAHLTTDD